MTPDSAARQDLLNRLSRIAGQVRGMSRMVEGDASCIDVLTQVSPPPEPLQCVVLRDHLRSCLAETADAGRLREASDAIARLVRS